MKDFLKAVVYASVFLVLFIPTMVTDSMFFPYITGKNFAFRILVEIALVGWVLLAFLDKDYRPRFSWIAVSGGALLIVMFFANLFGEYAPQSFWSNYERMEGYVTLVHFYAYFLVLGSVFQSKKMWGYFLHTSLAVATYVALFGLAQTAGVVEGARERVDSTLGNAAYMAIYMLFHIFIIFFLASKTRDWFVRAVYGIIFVLFVYILLETGTRGTFLGLVGGVGVMSGYLAVFGRAYPEVRKFAIGSILLVVVLVGGLFIFKDSQFIKESTSLNRIASINLSTDLGTRSTIWKMALEGVAERPILGWGQGNFNYIFNQQFEPSLYAGEQWFDRVHNIFLDWLVAGGVLGFVAYFGILLSAIYYLFWRPMFQHDVKNDDQAFTVLERAILLGILAGYLIHNVVVFDNLVSYTFYAVILGLIHSQVATPITRLSKFKVDEDIFATIVAPTAIIFLVVVIYLVHVPGIMAARDIIDAFRTQNVETRFAEFQTALGRGSFADQEIVEQLAQQAISLGRQTGLNPEVKEKYLKMAETEISNLIVKKPGDARLHVFFAGYYRSIGDLNKAKEQIDIARSLSPNKQSIILEQGVIALSRGENEAGRDYFKTALDLDPRFDQARFLYAGSLMYTGQTDQVLEAVGEDKLALFSKNDFALGAAEQSKSTGVLKIMLEKRLEADPANAQNYASLAFVYYREGDMVAAVDILKRGVEKVPTFAKIGTCYIGNIEKGEKPDLGC
jgi:O-antigen ligase/tetratricopeptide (TPR) repeat protein